MKLPPKDHQGHFSVEGLFRKTIIPSLMFAFLPVMLWVIQTEPTYFICHWTTTEYYVPIAINSKEQALAHKNHPRDFISPVEDCSERLITTITPTSTSTPTREPSITPTNTPTITLRPLLAGESPGYPAPPSGQPTPSDTLTQVPPTLQPSPSQTPGPTVTPRPTGEISQGIGTTAIALIIALALIAFAVLFYILTRN